MCPKHVGLDGGEVLLGIGLAGETLGPLPALLIAPHGSPTSLLAVGLAEVGLHGSHVDSYRPSRK